MKIEKILGYTIHRKKVKNINLRINENMEVYISAPINLDSYYIKKFILSKEDWIKNVLKKIENVKKNRIQKKYITGEKLWLIGREYTLIVERNIKNNVKIENDKILLFVKNDIFEEKKKILDKWYYNSAKKVFNKVIDKWLKKLDETIEHLSVKPMKTRWGSCNHYKRYINLNTELVKRTPFEIEYVVLHELAHLKYPNHGKGFYRYVENYMPNYREAEKMLSNRID